MDTGKSKAERAAEKCVHCRQNRPRKFWQGENVHNWSVSIDGLRSQFSTTICLADDIWKEPD